MCIVLLYILLHDVMGNEININMLKWPTDNDFWFLKMFDGNQGTIEWLTTMCKSSCHETPDKDVAIHTHNIHFRHTQLKNFLHYFIWL